MPSSGAVSLGDYFAFSQFGGWLLLVLGILGLVLLWKGGDYLTDGAASLALIAKLSPLVVGLTLVSAATSFPELITSFLSARQDSDGIAVGNIIGSNICNIGLILGIAAVIWPFKVQSQLVKGDAPFLVGVTCLFFALVWNGVLGHAEGLFLLGLTIAYVAFLVYQARRKGKAGAHLPFDAEVEQKYGSVWPALLATLAGGVALGFGADLLVNASVEGARRIGISESLIGLTLVALGTSLPELAASIAAAKKKHTDIVAGNIVGSNLFNLMFIGGAVSSFYTLEVDPQLRRFELPAMLFLTLLLWRAMATKHYVNRLEGAILLALYGAILFSSYALSTGLFG